MKIISLTILMLLHPVHVSLTGIDYDNNSRIYNIFVKVYCDDLEADMKLSPGSKDGANDADNERFCNYLCDRVLILEDGENLNMKLLTSETDGVERRFTLEVRGRKAVKSVTVINRIMTRLYSDQANMLLFRFNDIEDGYKFTATDTLRNYNVK